MTPPPPPSAAGEYTEDALIGIALDKLPKVYAPDIYEKKCNLAYRHVFDCYHGPGQSVYQTA